MPVLETKGAISAQGFGLTLQQGAVDYVEDVFSAHLYSGTGATQTITNGVNLSGKGGMLWLKGRSAITDPVIVDTVRGANKVLYTNSTAAEATSTAGRDVSAFTSSGFTLGALSSQADVNTIDNTYVSWTFREQPKFFDVVTYTGDGANRTVAHNLGSEPGCIIIKRTSGAGDWFVYHRSLGNTQAIFLNSASASNSGSFYWNSTSPTSTVFSLGASANANINGATYVAYLFAHNAGGFGLTGTDNVISCASFVAEPGTGDFTVDLGYEPQWILYKRSDGSDSWRLVDNMRGMPVTSSALQKRLFANGSNAEADASTMVPTATGFRQSGGGGFFDGSTYIYITVRRGPMKVPTLGTTVFTTSRGSGTSGLKTTNFPVDLVISKNSYEPDIFSSNFVKDRLRGGATSANLITNSTGAETSLTSGVTQFDFQNGIFWTTNGSGYQYLAWCFRRASGFFDEVCYTGTGSARTVAHNLAAVPELMINKARSTTADWWTYSAATGPTQYLSLNRTNAVDTSSTPWNNTAPTSSVFSLGSAGSTNDSGVTYVQYLFATCPGVSKVGSYTGTGATQVINCGFTGGARFVLIKVTSTTGGWYVWDSVRGIVAGNDPYLLLNTTAPEVTTTDWVDTAATGFELSNAGGNLVNSSGESYIFLAIA